MSLLQGPQGAMQLIPFELFRMSLNRRSDVNNDELEDRLRKYINDKFNTLKIDEIKQAIKTDILSSLPDYLRKAGFQTKKELEEYIKSLNLVLKREFDDKMAELDRIDKANADAISDLYDKIATLNDDYNKFKIAQGLINSEQDSRNVAYGVIDDRVEDINTIVQDLKNKKNITEEVFNAYKQAITEEMNTIKTSMALIQSMKQNILTIRQELEELKSFTNPDIARRLEDTLKQLEIQIPSADLDKLNSLRSEIAGIDAKFTGELQQLRREINGRIDTELSKLPNTDEFTKLKALVDEFRQLSPGSLRQLKTILDEVGGIRDKIKLLNKTPADFEELKDELNAKIDANTETIMQTIALLIAELKALQQSKANKYLKGGSPDGVTYEDPIKTHISRANLQIELASNNITELLKEISEPVEEHITELEQQRSKLEKKTTEHNKIEQLLLETIAVRNRFAHEVENGLIQHDLIGIKKYAEKEIANIKNRKGKVPEGNPIYPDIPEIKINRSIYKLSPKESIKDTQILKSRDEQIEELSKAIQKHGDTIRSFILGLGLSIDQKDKLYQDLKKDFKIIYEKYTSIRKGGDHSHMGEFILTETPTF